MPVGASSHQRARLRGLRLAAKLGYIAVMQRITTPDDPVLRDLCEALRSRSGELDRTGQWPAEQLRLCGEAGVYEWFLAPEWGGQDWNEEQVVRGYLALSEACLATTFIITQRTGACRRIAGCNHQPLKERLLPDLVSGAAFATVGISHLTTSRRHLARPILTSEPTADGFVLDGFVPWVTGAQHAQTIVVGATMLNNGEPTADQILLAVPTDLPGLEFPPPEQLVALSASQTGEVRFNRASVSDEFLLAGPVENVMATGIGGRTGGHETSALALGLSAAALDYLRQEAGKRNDLVQAAEALAVEHAELKGDLLAIARGDQVCTNESLRGRANSLVLRSTEAALTAAKGTGFVASHSVGRWCREALFFLVWSCPQPVASAHLCALAGIGDA